MAWSGGEPATWETARGVCDRVSCCLLATLMAAQRAVSWPPRRQCDRPDELGTATEAIEIALVTLPEDDDEDGPVWCGRSLSGWAGPGWACLQLQIWRVPPVWAFATGIKHFVSKQKVSSTEKRNQTSFHLL